MMEMISKEMLKVHPCFSHQACARGYGRIHLPVAPKCNVKCNYCERKIGSCYTIRPGVSSKVISPVEGLRLVSKYAKDVSLRVIGIAGPGEPLFNIETFQTLRLLHNYYPDRFLCICTNGLLLPDYIEELFELGVRACTVTVNAIDPKIATNFYSYIRYGNQKLKGIRCASLLIQSQITGIAEAALRGMIVKVNTVLIPEINMNHIIEISRVIANKGAFIQNIIPLIPLGNFKNLRPPTCDELCKVRDNSEQIIPQFRKCMQCRADSIGSLRESKYPLTNERAHA